MCATRACVYVDVCTYIYILDTHSHANPADARSWIATRARARALGGGDTRPCESDERTPPAAEPSVWSCDLPVKIACVPPRAPHARTLVRGATCDTCMHTCLMLACKTTRGGAAAKSARLRRASYRCHLVFIVRDGTEYREAIIARRQSLSIFSCPKTT